MHELCRVSDIPEDNGLEIRRPGPGGPLNLALFRTAGRVQAWRNVCPHMGRSLTFAPGEFLLGDRGELICPHHGASFDLRTGQCLSGPCAGDRLQTVEVIVENDRVLLRGDEQ